MKRGATVAVWVLLAVATVGGAAWFLLRDPSAGGAIDEASDGSRGVVARREDPGLAASRPAAESNPSPAKPISSAPFDPNAGRTELFVSGTVFEDAGRPVVGARVELLVDASRTLTQFSEGALVAETATAESGAFQFDDAARLRSRDRYLLRVRHPDFQLERVSPIDPAVPATLRRDILLRRNGGGIAGLITDEYGTPLKAAVVAVYDASQPSSEFLGALEKEAPADPSGKYRIASLRAGFKTVRVTAPGYTTAARADFEVREGVTVELGFRLARGRAISGNVVGRDTGQGVEGAVVVARLLRLDGQRAVDPADAEKHAAELAKVAAEANEEAAARAAKRAAGKDEGAADSDAEPATAEDELRRQRAQWATLRKAPPGVAKSDKDGAFEIQGLEDGAYEIIVRAAGYQESPPTGVMAGEAVLVEISRNGALRGRCVDAVTGEPIPNFTLAAVAGPEQRFVPSSTKRAFGGSGAADGAFEYGDLAPGRWQLVGEAKGYAGGRSDVVQLSLGEIRDGLVVRLERGVRVGGKVVDAAGKGVGGVGVVLEPSDLAAHPLAAIMMRQVRRDRISATTDAQGRYSFPNVLAGSYFVETAEGALAPSKTSVFVVGTAAFEAPDLQAMRGGALTGRVLRKSDREPDSSATVRIAPYATATDPAAFTGAAQREAVTDAAGRFSVEGLPAGTYRVVVVRRESVQNFAELLGTVARAQGAPAPTHVLTEGATVDVGDL